MEKTQEKYLNRIIGSSRKRPFYIKKKEAYSPDWVGEWERVKKMRKENHPLIFGGNFRGKIPGVNYENN